MEEAKVSWNTIYQSKEGFECQITLRDEDEANLIQRAAKVMAGITKSGGSPVKRWSNFSQGNAKNKADKGSNPNSKTYVDEKGVRRCNVRLKNGQICGTPVIEREGRYRKYWFCPNYKNHAL